ncbi:unnamed protein product, partial [Arctia plantaginis]
QSF